MRTGELHIKFNMESKMKWVHRIFGFLIALQCIGLYSGAIKDLSLHLQGWHGPLGKSILKAFLGTVFLAVGLYAIRYSFKSTANVANETVENLSNVVAKILSSEWEPYNNMKVKVSHNDFLENLSIQILEGKDSAKIANYLTKNSKRNLILDHDRKHDVMIAKKINNIEI